MAEIYQNEFTMYKFKDGELAQATAFTELSLQYIRTVKGRAAIEKSNIGFINLEDSQPILRSEYLRGYIAALDLLLQDNESHESERLQNLEASMEGQGNFSNEIPSVDVSRMFQSLNPNTNEE